MIWYRCPVEKCPRVFPTLKEAFAHAPKCVEDAKRRKDVMEQFMLGLGKAIQENPRE